MAAGVVKFYSAEKGFRFIISTDGGPDDFVHISSFAEGLKYLTEGQRVRYDVRTDQRRGKSEAYAVALL